MKAKTGILLVNLGSPDNARYRDVYRYLTEFLNDPRVIDLPILGRLALVNLLIIPLRCGASTKAYKKLWSENGSPLIYWSKIQQQKLQAKVENDATVYLAMRYQKPSVKSVVEKMHKDNIEKIIVIPMYPQYASASTGTVVEKVLDEVKKWWVTPELRVIQDFYDHPNYIGAIVNKAKAFDVKSYDHVLFSFHGLPTTQLDRVYDEGECDDHDCSLEINETNSKCYKAQSYQTARSLAAKLDLTPEEYTVCFQSRLDKKWTKPFTDKTLIRLAQEGMKKVLVFSPAFVADCLETTIEIGDEFKELFEENGGVQLDLVPGINGEDEFIDCLFDLAKI
ncbi:MAG: ferrochelatase [Flavobacteriales bacterium]